ncbi:hypothetical protein [Alkalicoccus saliphilus]|uniref:Uncharacterized protein n=1 Tax=Alkalicoccus saliphilus TaxID=200989 RepID=A0A2T4U9Q9_9BACI|nr:hypothetical protein [Alkalicoccus saliphilus]PTL40134.1 hypothetical protein C6Y45_01780 [Alkalicoccus saliphilus]
MNFVKPLLWINLLGSTGALIFYLFTFQTMNYRDDFLVLVGLFIAVSALGLFITKKLENEQSHR